MLANRGAAKKLFKTIIKRYYSLTYGRWDVFEKTYTWFTLKSQLTEEQINEFKELWFSQN